MISPSSSIATQEEQPPKPFAPRDTSHFVVQFDGPDDLALFSRVARHQFVHALFHEQAKNGSASPPTWLVEGLAIHLTEDPWPDMEESRQKSLPLMPLPSLYGSWTQLPSISLPTAYLTASDATQHLIDRYSMYTVRQLMNVFMTGQPLETAMQQKLSVSYEQFQRQWAQSHKPQMRTSGS